MADPTIPPARSAESWWEAAGPNCGIIGLSGEPFDDESWPTEGYDGALREFHWEEPGNFAPTGHTREEWLALADAMIARWTAWKAHIAALPDDPSVPPSDPHP